VISIGHLKKGEIFSRPSLELGIINLKPESDRGEFDKGEEVGGMLLMARRNAPTVFYPVEELLDLNSMPAWPLDTAMRSTRPFDRIAPMCPVSPTCRTAALCLRRRQNLCAKCSTRLVSSRRWTSGELPA